MEKMFKRTLLGAAVALAATAGSANAAIELAGENVVFYGQAAGNIAIGMPAEGDNSVGVEIESRIGFRGRVQFDDLAPDFIWQIEGGNADNAKVNTSGENANLGNNGQLGARDTFLGFDFDGLGSFKYGRQLVAAYNYVDWPHSHIGLGGVFDWRNDINGGFEDRADNVLRFDSANFEGFNFQATLSNMDKSTDNIAASVAGSYGTDLFNIHAGYYNKKGGGEYAIIGGQLNLGATSITAAYKPMKNGSLSQDAYSFAVQHVINGKVVLKGGVAANSEVESGDGLNDLAVNGRLGYILPSAYLYMDLRNYKINDADKFDSTLMLGAEYYF